MVRSPSRSFSEGLSICPLCTVYLILCGSSTFVNCVRRSGRNVMGVEMVACVVEDNMSRNEVDGLSSQTSGSLLLLPESSSGLFEDEFDLNR